MGLKIFFFALMMVAVIDLLIGTVDAASGKKHRTSSAKHPKVSSRQPPKPVSGAYQGGPWILAHATFYGDETAQETMGGACGYGNLYSTGYGTDTTALSSVLFNNGNGCGGCYEIRCVNSPQCFPASTIVTATNLCPPNWAEPSNAGGWCNPPRLHFDMSKPAFMKIADWKAGIVPVTYRRVPCTKTGGLKFSMQGNKWWALVYITNVGGPGDIASVSIKGSKTGWMSMSHNWGASYQVFYCLQGQSISFAVTSYTTSKTVIAWDVTPPNWQIGQTYESTIQLQ